MKRLIRDQCPQSIFQTQYSTIQLLCAGSSPKTALLDMKHLQRPKMSLSIIPYSGAFGTSGRGS